MDDYDVDEDREPFPFVRWGPIRSVRTIRFVELDEDPDVASAAPMGAPWYDCPYGTTDLEGGSP